MNYSIVGCRIHNNTREDSMAFTIPIVWRNSITHFLLTGVTTFGFYVWFFFNTWCVVHIFYTSERSRSSVFTCSLFFFTMRFIVVSVRIKIITIESVSDCLWKSAIYCTSDSRMFGVGNGISHSHVDSNRIDLHSWTHGQVSTVIVHNDDATTTYDHTVTENHRINHKITRQKRQIGCHTSTDITRMVANSVGIHVTTTARQIEKYTVYDAVKVHTVSVNVSNHCHVTRRNTFFHVYRTVSTLRVHKVWDTNNTKSSAKINESVIDLIFSQQYKYANQVCFFVVLKDHNFG